MRLLIDGHGSANQLSVPACERPAATAGPPLHIHEHTDELFIVQGGTLLLHADGQTHRLQAGDVGFVQRDTPHTFAAAPGRPARFIGLCTPAGFEQMHREVHCAEQAAGRPFGPAEIMPIARRHDWKLAGPPLLPTGELASTASIRS